MHPNLCSFVKGTLEEFSRKNYDGIILDLMMPKKNGIEVLSELRKEGVSTPVLILSAKADVDDRIVGLDA